jgi:hypothetical protein
MRGVKEEGIKGERFERKLDKRGGREKEMEEDNEKDDMLENGDSFNPNSFCVGN